MTSMPSVWLVSVFALLIMAMVIAQERLPIGSRLFFAVGLFVAATITFMVGFRLEFGMSELAAVQPHLAILIAPALLLGFRALTHQSGWPEVSVLSKHGAGILLAELAIALPVPWSADIVVLLFNAVYLVLFARLMRLDGDEFVHVSSQSAKTLRIALIGSIAFLSLVLLADTAIVFAMLSAGTSNALQFLSGASGVVVACVLLGALIGLPVAVGRRSAATDKTLPGRAAQAEDREVLSRVDAFLSSSQIFKDPSLTLVRIARRLGLPAKTVSSAVNRVTGENLSRYVNGFRVRHAVELLQTTALPVTEVMLEAGFVSKSSFNTEFRRITGRTPTQLRKSDTARQNNVLNHDTERSKS